MRLASRFKGQEVIIKETSSEEPWICTINRIYKEAGEPFYELESEGEIFALAVSSVEWIKPRKAVKKLNIVNLAPLRVLQTSHN